MVFAYKQIALKDCSLLVFCARMLAACLRACASAPLAHSQLALLVGWVVLVFFGSGIEVGLGNGF